MLTANDKTAYVNDLQRKITTLQFIGKNLDGCHVDIIVTLKCGSKVLLQQHFIPFNLAMEVRSLVDDSIDELQRMAVNIQNA